MKKTKLNKKGKQPISKIQKKLWELCREKASRLYKKDCYTCGARNLVGRNCQLGHLWAKASLPAILKYDIRILRWQCFSCNIYKGGMGAVFYRKMLDENGKEYMDSLEKNKNVLVKAYDHYLQLIELYKRNGKE